MLKRRTTHHEMRVVSGDGREVIATSEELTSASALPTETIQDAQHINLSFNALTSLHGLHVATQLRNLNVSHNAIVSLHGVETFQHLQRLRCSGNRICDLSWLVSLPHLRELWVNDNEIETSQIAHVASLRSLETLILHPNPCTHAVNYVSYVVKTVPWLARVDFMVVDDALRQQSQHVDERAFLSSAATDVSEISLMTSRSDDTMPDTQDDGTLRAKEKLVHPPLEVPVEAEQPKPAIAASTQHVEATAAKKKTKKMIAEDFMRAFPVQDFIPSSDEDPQGRDHSSLAYEPAQEDGKQPPQLFDSHHGSNQENHAVEEQVIVSHEPLVNESIKREPKSSTSLSAIASAVQSLPLFAEDGVLQKKKTQTIAPTKTKKSTKKGTASKPAVTTSPDPALASFRQEWILPYPNSTVSAIQVRTDGSAVAKWPSGSVAVSIDRERDGFRCYAAHKDGTIALSFDADGVGFINYYPSGRMMISTSSSGDGLYFSNEGSIVRQWDAQLNMKNDKWELTDRLSDVEPDGALVTKLSDGLGVRFQLKKSSIAKHEDGSHRPSALALTIFFSSGSGPRHAFYNWINKSEPNGGLCDIVFGKDAPKLKKKPSESRVHTHVDTLHDIRAAVAKLS